MPTFRLLIEYEGTRYSGWQAQSNTPRTVQGALVRAATQVLGQVSIGGSGRTDAGVHAAGQVAHLRTRTAAHPVELRRKLNDLLPHDIHLLDITAADDAFHARHDAASRIYLYQVSRRRTAFAKPFVWWIRDPLDVDRMSEASRGLLGMHDFSALADKRIGADESTLVHVERLDVGTAGELILIRIQASHFLWKMVRKVVALLAEVGRGTLSDDPVKTVLEGKTRFQPTAPPSGLFLERVLYAGETFDRPLIPLIPVETAALRIGAPGESRRRDHRRNR